MIKKEEFLKTLEDLSKLTNWNAVLIKYEHKDSHSTFDIKNLEFNKPKYLNDTVTEILKISKKTINKYYEEVLDYDGYNTKKSIDKLNINNDIIKDLWNCFLSGIDNLDDSSCEPEFKSINAYCFYNDTISKNDRVYIISKKNPVINLKNKTKFFYLTTGKLSPVDKVQIQFNKCFDFIVYEDNIYTINKNFEQIFNLNKTLKNIKDQKIINIENSNIIADINSIKNYASKGKNYLKFKTFSDDKLKEIVSNIDKIDYLKAYLGITKDANGKLIIDSEKKAEKLINILCNKTKRDVLSNDLFKVNSSQPINPD